MLYLYIYGCKQFLKFTFRCNVRANHKGTLVLTPAEKGPTRHDIILKFLSCVKLGIISINVSLATKVEIDCNREVDVVARGDGMSAKK